MPKSVIWVVAVMFCIAALNFAALVFSKGEPSSSESPAFQVFLSGLVLVGFIKGNRLAWQWGRYLAFIAGLGMTTAILIPAVASRSLNVERALLLGLGLAIFSIPFALGRSSAIQYFGLLCPSCGKKAARAVDFLYTKARCKACNYTW